MESGSTLTYVADRIGAGLSEARMLDESGVPHIGVSTNNVLAYLVMWLKRDIPTTLFPWGTPDKTYGACLGCLDIDVVDQSPQYPPGLLSEDELIEISKLKKAAEAAQLFKGGAKSLLLGATSGLQLTDKFKLKGQIKTDGIKQCRGPHVGSYKNKLFKRFMYEIKHPLMLFLTSDKIDSDVNVGKCHFVLDDKNHWERFIKEHPLAFCIGTDRTHRKTYIELFEQYGFISRSRNDEQAATAFIARNQKFIDVFEKPNNIVS